MEIDGECICAKIIKNNYFCLSCKRFFQCQEVNSEPCSIHPKRKTDHRKEVSSSSSSSLPAKSKCTTCIERNKRERKKLFEKEKEAISKAQQYTIITGNHKEALLLYKGTVDNLLEMMENENDPELKESIKTTIKESIINARVLNKKIYHNA